MYWILEKQPGLLTNCYTRPIANILLLQLIMCNCTHELVTHTQCHYQAQLIALLSQNGFCQPCKIMSASMGPKEEPNKKYCMGLKIDFNASEISHTLKVCMGLYLDVSWTHSYYKFMVVFATFYPTFPTPSPTHPYLAQLEINAYLKIISKFLKCSQHPVRRLAM